MDIKKIMVDIPLYEARNLEHHQLNNDVREVLPPELAEQLHLTPLLTPYLEQCDKEDECVLINRAYEDTAAIKEADHRRDQLFLYIPSRRRKKRLIGSLSCRSPTSARCGFPIWASRAPSPATCSG